MNDLIKEILQEKQTKRGWKVELNGEVVANVSKLTIANPRYGELNYGLTAPGYDGWSFHEIGGGGIVTVPFAKIDGQLYVGMVLEDRHNQGGKVWNLPRGFLNPGETHFESMAKELEEEIGYLSPDKRMKDLGNPMNPNSAFFETTGKNEGVKFYSIEFLSGQLVLQEGGHGFKPGLMRPVSKVAERIFAAKFFTWRIAVQAGDMFTVAGIARLLASELVGF